jgi:hypothetical protein
MPICATATSMTMTEEQGAGPHGTHAEATVSLGLRQQVAERSAEGTGQDVADPEGQHGVAAHAPGGIGDADQRTKGDSAPGKAQPSASVARSPAAPPSANVQRMADQ